MPNITVTVSEQTYRRARVRAAELSTSVSAVVARTLEEFAAADTAAESRKRRFEELRARTPIVSAGRRLSREDLYGKPGGGR
jgi:post-segregation antitoxin (ccd killing protein)